MSVNRRVNSLRVNHRQVPHGAEQLVFQGCRLGGRVKTLVIGISKRPFAQWHRHLFAMLGLVLVSSIGVQTVGSWLGVVGGWGVMRAISADDVSSPGVFMRALSPRKIVCKRTLNLSTGIICTINHQHQVVEAVGLVVVVHIDLEEFRNMPISFAFEVAHTPQEYLVKGDCITEQFGRSG